MSRSLRNSTATIERSGERVIVSGVSLMNAFLKEWRPILTVAHFPIAQKVVAVGRRDRVSPFLVRMTDTQTRVEERREFDRAYDLARFLVEL